jgi:HK97 family phage major capsid protein
MKPEDIKTEFRNLAAELKDAVISDNQEAITKINERMDALEDIKTSVGTVGDRLDSLELEVKKRPVATSTEDVSRQAKSEFKSAFQAFHKGDLADIKEKAYSHVPEHFKSDNMVRFDFGSAGALLVQPSFSQEIIRDAVEATPVMQLVKVTPISSTEHNTRRRKSTPGGRWLGEEEQNTDKGKIKYDVVKITPHEWAARYGVTHQQMRDSAYNMTGEITDAFSEDFSIDVGGAVVNGDGIGKPQGMVGNITNFNADQLALTIDNLIQMQESIKEPYHDGASWLITRKTRAYIRTKILTAGADLNGAWEPNLTRRTPSVLLGAPVFIAREGDLAGKFSGNFTAGNVYAIYGNFRKGYEAVVRENMYMIDDPYSEASSFVRNYHILTSVGGNVIQPEALVQITAAGS